MRRFLIILCLIAMVVVIWHAVFNGTERPGMAGAPQIQQRVSKAVATAIRPFTSSTMAVKVSGRTVTLTGIAAGRAEYDKVIAAIRNVPLAGEIKSSVKVLNTVSPYVLTIDKAADGTITLEGHMPSAEVQEAVLTEALRAGDVRATLKGAAGVPRGDWAGMVRAGIVALAQMKTGKIVFSDTTALLNATAPNAAARDKAKALIKAAPLGTWTVKIDGQPPKDGFVFSATKTAGGKVLLSGHAPDDAVRKRLFDTAATLGGGPVVNGLELALGMPDNGWPDRAVNALAGLRHAVSGSVTVRGAVISLDASVTDARGASALKKLGERGWKISVKVLNTTPPADVTFKLTKDGKIMAAGLLPEGADTAMLSAAFQSIDLAGIASDRRGLATDWKPAVDALSIVLPRFLTAEVKLTDRSLTLKGVLNREYNAEGVEAAVRSALKSGWTLKFDVSERPPLSEVVLTHKKGVTSMSGLLPKGISSADAVKALGLGVASEKLTSGGEGTAQQWRHNLGVAGEAVTLFHEVTAKMSEGQIVVQGILKPGYTEDEVLRWLKGRVSPGWRAGIGANETVASEGDQRVNLATGKKETFRTGHWLADLDFKITKETCKAEFEGVLDGAKLKFLPGTARFRKESEAYLDRLAAVAVHCLGDAKLMLEIAGHTDSVGNDRSNMRLSKARAAAMRKAVVTRGAKPDRVIAIGRGEEEPFTTNDTFAGRRANNRLEFRWHFPDEPRPKRKPKPAGENKDTKSSGTGASGGN